MGSIGAGIAVACLCAGVAAFLLNNQRKRREAKKQLSENKTGMGDGGKATPALGSVNPLYRHKGALDGDANHPSLSRSSKDLVHRNARATSKRNNEEEEEENDGDVSIDLQPENPTPPPARTSSTRTASSGVEKEGVPVSPGAGAAAAAATGLSGRFEEDLFSTSFRDREKEKLATGLNSSKSAESNGGGSMRFAPRPPPSRTNSFRSGILSRPAAEEDVPSSRGSSSRFQQTRIRVDDGSFREEARSSFMAAPARRPVGNVRGGELAPFRRQQSQQSFAVRNPLYEEDEWGAGRGGIRASNPQIRGNRPPGFEYSNRLL